MMIAGCKTRLADLAGAACTRCANVCVNISTDPANCGASCTRTSADALAGSPVVGDILYTVTYASVVLADLRIHTDLGSLEANGTYKQSPSS